MTTSLTPDFLSPVQPDDDSTQDFLVLDEAQWGSLMQRAEKAEYEALKELLVIDSLMRLIRLRRDRQSN